MKEFLFLLTNAAVTTLKLAICALIIGLILAISLALIEELKFLKWLRLLCKILLFILYGLPEILVVLFIYLGISQLLLIATYYINKCMMDMHLGFFVVNLNISPFSCGVISLALLYAAYAYQTIQGAIKVISKGQWESGQSLGMDNFVIFFRLILPQIWRYALPGLGNQWLVLLKDTTLVSLISVNDLMLQTKNIIIITNKPYTWYIVSAMIYLIIALFSQGIIYILQRKIV
ncbi:arginine ABC transporter permease ArtQ [Candidatus Palibaumannia cicadellinicola]|uniref:Arginine ABC transporter, permease protein n=1 Tax=Baumannia cicadellinicola subsp. Homalodisca coagulata TaxID=374463 RepID=Q1LTE1_BAUCH|nr:arginine ABC transporter permease ArtQ [Candidatus Baumannia cicadellinicola]ABF14263.1 arginine ABC transporter, permease protein [Baumannia cicadellinicola str. Hc (Homalodisca coagulata)]MCJ7462245.1 arginine ABC transporter permease ArtQ [Candidatus Baumannia cicadellinicola]MCJ7462763.1 arginine ABC transporter permease ArtQ [Candidatus Baumannia cicadellinicola]